jgi:hypothetical protein
LFLSHHSFLFYIGIFAPSRKKIGTTSKGASTSIHCPP